MTADDESNPEERRAPSRAPVYLVICGLALAVTLVFLAATQARQPVAPPPIERAGTPEAPRDVTIVMRDYVFVPSDVMLVPGETVRLSILNGGLVPHELVLGDARFHAAWSAADAAATPPAPFATARPASVLPEIASLGARVLLDSGGQSGATFVVPGDGAGLTMVCHLPGHEARGMIATVSIAAVRR